MSTKEALNAVLFYSWIYIKNLRIDKVILYYFCVLNLIKMVLIHIRKKNKLCKLYIYYKLIHFRTHRYTHIRTQMCAVDVNQKGEKELLCSIHFFCISKLFHFLTDWETFVENENLHFYKSTDTKNVHDCKHLQCPYVYIHRLYVLLIVHIYILYIFYLIIIIIQIITNSIKSEVRMLQHHRSKIEGKLYMYRKKGKQI